jgi:hypothetical protein
MKRCQRSRLRQKELKITSDIESYIWDEINYGLSTTVFDDYKKDK